MIFPVCVFGLKQVSAGMSSVAVFQESDTEITPRTLKQNVYDDLIGNGSSVRINIYATCFRVSLFLES